MTRMPRDPAPHQTEAYVDSHYDPADPTLPATRHPYDGCDSCLLVDRAIEDAARQRRGAA